ncbi:MAG: J domain-containing protein [Parvularculaceae bacterium]
MAKNPYSILGVPASATESEIRAAFRKLAKQHHPDRNPGDKAAEEKFKEISSAFDLLSDPAQRKRFDAGEIDAEGKERSHSRNWQGGGAYRPGTEGFGPGYNAGAGGANFEDLGDIFSDLFGSQRGFRDKAGARGRDLRYRLEVDFLDAVNGATKRATMPDGRELDISIPAGIEDAQTLRLKGQGEKAAGTGAVAGDVYVEVKVKAHPVFRREGADIHIEAPITLKEAVLGGKITAPTISGDVSLTVPKNTSSGAILRLKGRGAPTGKTRGDQFVKLRIVLPEAADPELEDFVKHWKGGERAAAKKTYAA